MTTKTLASITLALIVAATAATGAEARTRHQHEMAQPTFDRHTGQFEYSASTKVAGLKQVRRKHQKQYRDRPGIPRNQAKENGHILVAATGAKTSVSTVARPHFQCLITKLEAVGYRIDFMGGYAGRGNSSAHPTGNALDINQIARNVVKRRLPENTTEMAADCGLVHGATWDNPDQGHFEMPRKYGYIFKQRRSRYASAH